MTGPSFWFDDAVSPEPPSVPPPRSSVDVLVVGAGIVGLTAALWVAEQGHRVAVVDGSRLGSGVTGQSTAKVTYGTGLRVDEILRRHGRDAAEQYLAAGRAGLAWVEEHCQSLPDSRAWTEPHVLYATTSTGRTDLLRHRAVVRSLGADVAEAEPPVSNATMALAYAGQMLVQPVDYLRELAAAVVEHGGTVTTSYPVRSIGRHQATGRDTIRATEVVAATHVPLGMLPATLPWRQARHYAALVQGEKVEVASLDVKAGWSVRPVTPSATRAIVVGSGGSTGSHDTTDALQQLETWARDRLRAVVLQTWSSQDVMTEDQLPYIGRLSPRGPLSATGFGAWGLAHGTAAGLELARRATGAEARWSSGDLTPTRLAKGSMDMVQGAAASASALLEQRVIQPVGAAVGFRRSASTPAELSPGEGRVTYEGAQPLATSCDASGEVRCLSAVCSHMGCTVVWNPAEQTWDCPCHGSRFDVDGRVLHGPAASPLAAR